MTLAKDRARANKIFIVQASLTIITYSLQKNLQYRPQVVVDTLIRYYVSTF